MNIYKRNIRLMYAFKMLRNLHFVGGVLVPFFMEWGKISFSQIMFLQAFYVICVFLLEVPTGAIADYFGRRASLTASALANMAGVLVYSSYPSFYVFMAGEFLWAMGVAFMSGADEAMVYDSLKKMKKEKSSKKIYGRFMSFEMAALMVAAPIGSIIAAVLGLRYTMAFMAVPMLIAAVISLFFKEPCHAKKTKNYIKTAIEGVKYFKEHKILKIMAFDQVSASTMIFFIIWFHQLLMKQLGVPIIYFGFVLALLTGIQIPVLNSFGYLERKIGSKKSYMLWSALLPGICFVLLGVVTAIPLVITLFAIISAFGLTRDVLYSNYMNKHIESKNRATVLSTISMINMISIGVAYPIIGLMAEYSLSITLIFIGVMTLIFAVVSRVEEEHLME